MRALCTIFRNTLKVSEPSSLSEWLHKAQNLIGGTISFGLRAQKSLLRKAQKLKPRSSACLFSSAKWHPVPNTLPLHPPILWKHTRTPATILPRWYYNEDSDYSGLRLKGSLMSLENLPGPISTHYAYNWAHTMMLSIYSSWYHWIIDIHN